MQILHFWILKSSQNCVKDDAFRVFFFKKRQEIMSMLQSRCNLDAYSCCIADWAAYTQKAPEITLYVAGYWWCHHQNTEYSYTIIYMDDFTAL